VIVSPLWRGKRYAVLGLARSGVATVRALLAGGAQVVAWDSSEERRVAILPGTRRWHAKHDGGGEPSTGALGADPLHHSPKEANGPPPRAGEDLVIADPETLDLTPFDALIVSPGVPLNRHPIAAEARAAGVPIIGDIELFAQARPSLPPHKVVGITGTNGKSTTTALVHHILQTAGVPSLMGGNIGLPILEQEPLPEGGVYVLELSSYQIDLTQTLDCDVAVLLNITPDHLDRYDGFEAYAASKARLFEMQAKSGLFNLRAKKRSAIISIESEPTQTIAAEQFSKMRYGQPVAIDGDSIRGRQIHWSALQGPHNLQNAAAAYAVALELGIRQAVVFDAFHTFTGLPHRMERIRTVAGVAYVNDSKATNPDSTAPALAAFDRIHWILGGQSKTDDLDACAPSFGHVARAYAIGDAAAKFAHLLEGKVPVEQSGTLATAVTSAAANAQPGDTVLLSPACASFDQFRDFEDRGDQFRALVEALDDTVGA
jgi:UDP-N-acetylmuramoylalanine--D-glutamate ligase